MREVHSGLWVGTLDDCSAVPAEWAVVHACKDPCHRRAVGYTGHPSPEHEHYLIKEAGRHLYLNLIDPIRPLFELESFWAALAFIRVQIREGPVLVHCNQGVSRSPSIAMLYLVRETKDIPGSTFEAARSAFLVCYPDYAPGIGIQEFLGDNWQALTSAG